MMISFLIKSVIVLTDDVILCGWYVGGVQRDVYGKRGKRWKVCFRPNVGEVYVVQHAVEGLLCLFVAEPNGIWYVCGFGFSLRLIFLDNSLLLRGSLAAATCGKDKLPQRSIADLFCLWQKREAGIEFLFAAEP